MKNIFTLLVIALVGLSLTACSEDDLSTNQYKDGVNLNAFGPNPVMRGGTLRFVGSNLDQLASITIPGMGAVTNFEIIKSGIPSEVRVQLDKDTPTVGYITLKTKTDQTITTKSELTYIEGIELESFSPESAMPGDVVTIKGDYLNLVHMVEFADGVRISEADFVAQDRYEIQVTVPEEAQTGKISVYTADLTTTLPDDTEVDYQIISFTKAIEIGVPTVSKLKGRTESEALGNIVAKAGEQVSISGSYFNMVADITVGGVSVTDMAMSEDGKTLLFTLPAEAPSGDILLVCKSGVEVPVGTLTTVKPTNGVATPNPVKAGKALTISGNDMDVVTAVAFPNADAVTDIKAEAGKVVVSAVPEKATEGNLQLVMANGESVEVTFTLVKPTVTSYSTTEASAGGALTITGTDLDLVKTVQFGEGSDIVEVSGATETAINLTVPMNALSGSPTLKLANGTSVKDVPSINIKEAVFCYAVELPSEEDELKAGSSMTLTVANGDKLTDVEMNGETCQWILTGEEKNQLIIGIPESAKAKSTLRLISSNGEITYNIAVIPATTVNKTLWSGLTEITWSDGDRVTVPAASFEGVPAGARLTFCYTQKAQVWAQAQVNYGNWSGINFTQAGDDAVTFNSTLVPTDIYGWFSDGILNRETTVILTKEILDNIQALKGGCEGQENCGIIIQGQDLIFTKITISWENPTEVTIWEGSVDCSSQPYIGHDAGQEFIDNDVKAGQTVHFYIEVSGSDWWFECFEGHWGPWYGKWTGETNPEITAAGKGVADLVLTQAMIDAALTQQWWGGIFVVQGSATLTKVTVE